LRIALTPAQRAELDRRLRARTTERREYERLAMVRAVADGATVPQAARALGAHEQTVRKFVKAFRTEGFAGLVERPRPGARRRLTEQHLTALETLIDHSDRTWTTPQLVAWLQQEHQVRVHPDYLSRVLHQRRFAWKGTKRSVAHKRKDPELYDAKVGELEVLKNRLSTG
jgi:transposase